MTLWTPVRSTASVELGGWSQQACLTGVGASTTTTAGADSAAWRRMMVAARPALVALPLGSRSSWSCQSWHGPAPCQGSVSSCWRSLGHCATALMWKRWALIRITIPRQRPMLWGPILSPHQRSIPPWPRNPSLQQSEQHTIAESQQVAVSCNISAAFLTEGSGASHARSARSAWNRTVRKHYLHLSCGNRKEFEPAAWQFMVLTYVDFPWRSLHRVASLRSKQDLWPCRKHAARLDIYHEILWTHRNFRAWLLPRGPIGLSNSSAIALREKNHQLLVSVMPMVQSWAVLLLLIPCFILRLCYCVIACQFTCIIMYPLILPVCFLLHLFVNFFAFSDQIPSFHSKVPIFHSQTVIFHLQKPMPSWNLQHPTKSVAMCWCVASGATFALGPFGAGGHMICDVQRCREKPQWFGNGSVMFCLN